MGMFNHHSNQQNSNTDMDQVAKEIDDKGQSIGLGMNPSSFTGNTDDNSSSTPDPITQASNNSGTPTQSSIHQTTSTLPSNLDNIKEQALKQLSPLVGKLDQSPEDKFKTLMMMIQASDSHDLIQQAYDAANKIEDETAKAQALLSIVNEINYFTQKQSS